MVALVCCERFLNHLRERNILHFPSGFLTATAVNCAESEKIIPKVGAISLRPASVCPEDNSGERTNTRISDTTITLSIFLLST